MGNNNNYVYYHDNHHLASTPTGGPAFVAHTAGYNNDNHSCHDTASTSSASANYNYDDAPAHYDYDNDHYHIAADYDNYLYFDNRPYDHNHGCSNNNDNEYTTWDDYLRRWNDYFDSRSDDNVAIFFDHYRARHSRPNDDSSASSTG